MRFEVVARPQLDLREDNNAGRIFVRLDGVPYPRDEWGDWLISLLTHWTHNALLLPRSRVVYNWFIECPHEFAVRLENDQVVIWGETPSGTPMAVYPPQVVVPLQDYLGALHTANRHVLDFLRRSGAELAPDHLLSVFALRLSRWFQGYPQGSLCWVSLAYPNLCQVPGPLRVMARPASLAPAGEQLLVIIDQALRRLRCTYNRLAPARFEHGGPYLLVEPYLVADDFSTLITEDSTKVSILNGSGRLILINVDYPATRNALAEDPERDLAERAVALALAILADDPELFSDSEGRRPALFGDVAEAIESLLQEPHR